MSVAFGGVSQNADIVAVTGQLSTLLTPYL